jgi:hypothetical protein
MKPLLDSDSETNRRIEERWLDVVGYEGLYSVSDMGRVYSQPRTEFVSSRRTGGHYRYRNSLLLSPTLNKLGYLQVGLHKDGICKLKTIHRLVATAFIPNPDKEVNHINGIRKDNRVENLEWSNRKHNSLHSTQVLGKK